MLQRDKIKILGLLSQREKEFMRIWDCENKIRGILNGMDYPFPRVVQLPSEKRSAPCKGAIDFSWVDRYRTTIRDLRTPEENVYKIEYLNQGKPRISFQTDRALVETLIDMSCEIFCVTKVIAGNFKSVSNWTPTETVWSSE